MKRIILIDDEPVLRLTFRHILEGKGYEVKVATNGREGVRLCQRHHPDLVITDLVMPEQDGITTIRLLREFNPAMPIIAISGHGEPNADTKNFADPNIRFEQKPIDGDQLLRLVRNAVGESEVNEAPLEDEES